MADTQPGTGMGPETPATTTRRTRRLALIGALALVLVAGAVLIGVSTSGARSGATYNSDICQKGGLCQVGEVGPGSGVVFYVASSDFACGTATCRYLEAAPTGWNNSTADPKINWDAAMSMASSYAGGSQSGWHLPTKDELLYLYVANGNPGNVKDNAGLTKSNYWSSTQSGDTAWRRNFADGVEGNDPKTGTRYVRPVRAF